MISSAKSSVSLADVGLLGLDQQSASFESMLLKMTRSIELNLGSVTTFFCCFFPIYGSVNRYFKEDAWVVRPEWNRQEAPALNINVITKEG